MTLHQFLRAHCCNHDVRTGRCVVLDDAWGGIRTCPVLDPEKRPTMKFQALLSEIGTVRWESCGPHFCTFGEALLRSHPAARHPLGPSKLSACQAEYARGRIPPQGGSLRDVVTKLGFPVENGDRPARLCPTPGCGNPLRARKRLCDACAKAARRETIRKEKARQRATIPGPTVNGFSPLGT